MVVPDDVRYAAGKGQLAPVQAWFESGDRDANNVDRYGAPLLHRAFQNLLVGPREGDRGAVMRYLVAQGADINRRSYQYGSYLHLVIGRWQLEYVQLSLELGADAALRASNHATDGNSVTPLEWAFGKSDSILFFILTRLF